MKELGQYLKKQRESQKLSLEDLETRTKIHIQKLRDIEAGNKDSLPAKVFCIGLIKSYARELRVDMDQLNSLISEAFQESPGSAEAPTIDTPPLKEPNKNDTEDPQLVGVFKIPKFITIGASGLLSLLLVFIIFQVVDKMNSYSKEEALPQEVFVSDDETVTSEVAELEKEDAEMNETDDPTNHSSEGQPETSGRAEDKSQTIRPKDSPAPEKANDVQPQKPVAQVKPMDMSEGDFSEDNFGGPPANEPDQKPDLVSDNKLTLTALEPVRAEVVWADGYVQVMLLKSNESKTLVFSQPITLRVNNGGAVQVSFNESEKKVPGSFNKPIEIQYP